MIRQGDHMYMVSLRKLTNVKPDDKGLVIESDPFKKRFFVSAKHAMNLFENWSNEIYNGNEFIVHRHEINFTQFLKSLFTKNDFFGEQKGTAKVKSFENNVLFLDLD
jgi:hypothetical protein